MLNTRSYPFTITAVMVLLAVTSSPVHAYYGNYADRIDGAQRSLEEKRYEEVVTTLNPMLQDDVEAALKARIHFLMGRAFYEKAFAVISAGRVDGKVKFKDIAPPQVKELKSAAEHFTKALEADPENELAADAYFMLGKVWDYDCLQKFKRSQDSYKRVVELSPESEIGTAAKECVDRIDGYFQGHSATH